MSPLVGQKRTVASLVRWFSPDLDLLLERDAAEEDRLNELEEAEKLHEREQLVRWPASTCMA